MKKTIEHMLFKGTSSRTKDQIPIDVENCGGRISAATGTDRTRYYAHMPYDKWKEGIALLTDMVFHSVLPEKEIELEKKVVLEEIHRARDNPREYGS
ncbi:MAG: peptidase domain protein, partial [Paenibacillus sp.]|nr:peptidase domain protein [Paenibacillus sp.]